MFVVKGFSARELASKYIVLELVGKTEEGKVFLGETVLAGRQGVYPVYSKLSAVFALVVQTKF